MTAVDRSVLPDETFRASCRAAFRAEVTIALTCVQRGAVEVQIPPYRITPNFQQRRNYRDNGDVYVRWLHGGHFHRYEVKHRPHEQFTRREEFMWDKVFVDEVVNLDDKQPPPDAYFICNADLTGALFIDLRRYNDLGTTTMFDARYKQHIDVYWLPIEQTRYIELQPTGRTP